MWEKLKKSLDSFKCGMKNLYRWFPVIWNDRQWDYDFFLRILEKKIELMEDYYRYYSVAVKMEKTANELKTCKILIKRLRELNYPNNVYFKIYRGDKITIQNNRLLFDHENYMENQDLEYLLKIFKRKLFTWWD